MPWTDDEFKKHAPRLSGAALSKAAAMATAMVENGTKDGVAIATAIKHGNAMMGVEKAKRRYAKKG